MNMTRIAARARAALHTTIDRLHCGHLVLVDAVVSYRPSVTPKCPQPDKPATGEDDAPAPDKKAAKGAKKKQGQEEPEKEDAPLRPGPRRAARAAGQWVAAGEGAADRLIRALLLIGALAVAAYFITPVLQQLPLPVLVLIPGIVILYDRAPRVALLAGAALVAYTVAPLWAILGTVTFFGVAIAPTLAPLLGLALIAAATTPAIMWPAFLIWTAAAWRAGAPEPLPDEAFHDDPEGLEGDLPEECPEPSPQTPQEQPLEEDPRTVLIHWLDHLTRGDTGVHLDRLHQQLTEHPSLASLTRREMRALLDRHEIPVERTLRVGGIGGRSGISRATVEVLLATSPLGSPSPLKSDSGGSGGTGAESGPDLHESSRSPEMESAESGPDLRKSPRSPGRRAA